MRREPLRRLLRLEEQRLELARLELARAAAALAEQVRKRERLAAERAAVLGTVPDEAAWLAPHVARAERLAQDIRRTELDREAAAEEVRRRGGEVAGRLARRKLLEELERRAAEEQERARLARERAELDDLAAGRARQVGSAGP